MAACPSFVTPTGYLHFRGKPRYELTNVLEALREASKLADPDATEIKIDVTLSPEARKNYSSFGVKKPDENRWVRVRFEGQPSFIKEPPGDLAWTSLYPEGAGRFPLRISVTESRRSYWTIPLRVVATPVCVAVDVVLLPVYAVVALVVGVTQAE
jgi:hypothetical protein